MSTNITPVETADWTTITTAIFSTIDATLMSTYFPAFKLPVEATVVATI
jgi:hypothetical protein